MDRLSLATVYLVGSSLAFVAYGIDKAAAIGGVRRIPEACLHLLGLIGGWPGALVAQRVFRHKSGKVSFQVAFWIVAALNCLAALWLLSVTWQEVPAGKATITTATGGSHGTSGCRK